jgi:hypothetical protein
VKGFPAIRAFVAKPGGKKVPAEAAIHFPGNVDEVSVSEFVKLTLRDKLHVIDTTGYAEHKKKLAAAAGLKPIQKIVGDFPTARSSASVPGTPSTSVVYQKLTNKPTTAPTVFLTTNAKSKVVLRADLAAGIFFWLKHNVLLQSELKGERLAHALVRLRDIPFVSVSLITESDRQ